MSLIVGQVCIIIILPVDEGSNFLERRLSVGIDDIIHVGAVVEVLIPVDGDIIVTWDTLPVVLVVLSELRVRLRLCDHDCAHCAW